MNARYRRDLPALVLLLVLTVLDGLLWSAATPLFQGTDEDGHFAVTQFIAEHLRLPDREDGFRSDEVVLAAEMADVRRLPYHPEMRQAFTDGRDGPQEEAVRTLDPAMRTRYELGAPGKLNHTSPLYYILGAVVYRLFYGADLLVRLYALRVFTVVQTVGMVLISYALGVQAFPRHPDAPLTVATLVSFQPMVSFIGAIVNNDILLSLLTAWAIWVLVQIWRHGLSLRRVVTLGLALGLGMLAKPLIAGLAIPVALVFARELWRKPRQWLRVVLLGALALVVSLVICGWWIVRSYDINDGELYMDEIKKGYRIVDNPRFDYRGRFWKHAADYYASIVGGVWGSYWAAFGWLDAPAPPIFYWAINAVALVGLSGLICFFVRAIRHRSWREAGTTFLSVVVVVSPVVMLQVYDFVYWCQHGMGRGLQGRYFFGEMATLFILGLVGYHALLPRRAHGALHWALRAGIIVANLACLLHVMLPRYYM